MYSLAIKTLFADRGKLLVALAGVVFSVALVNVQGGLFLGLLRKAALLVDNSTADIWIGHRRMHNVDFPRDIPRRWVDRVRTVDGVAQAEPYLIGFSDMTLPDGGYEGVFVVGAERTSLLGGPWNLVEGDTADLLRTDAVIVDASDDAKLGHPQIGEMREIGHQRARIVAKTYGVAGFLVTPYVFTTYDRAASYTRKSPEQCSYILVETAPGADVEQTCRLLRARLPHADVLPRQTYGAISVDYWMQRTGLGISFGAATVLGLFIGLVMVAQTMYAMVLDRLAEFGTLKAMGATLRQICVMLLTQALLMAVVGSLVGLGLVALVQRFYSSPHAPIVIPWWLSLSSFALVVVICLISAMLPYLRVRRIDPLIVLQS